MSLQHTSSFVKVAYELKFKNNCQNMYFFNDNYFRYYETSGKSVGERQKQSFADVLQNRFF